MSQLTNITIDYVDNELYVLAYNNDGRPGWMSSELAHFKGGSNQLQTYSWNPAANAVLPPGNYTLLLIGINWGGPSNFKGSVTIGGTTHPLAVTPTSATGVTYTQELKFTV